MRRSDCPAKEHEWIATISIFFKKTSCNQYFLVFTSTIFGSFDQIWFAGNICRSLWQILGVLTKFD
jgi:hypothetical protein